MKGTYLANKNPESNIRKIFLMFSVKYKNHLHFKIQIMSIICILLIFHVYTSKKYIFQDFCTFIENF
jgi:hypothetical protein